MRPPSIVRFERLFVATIVVGVATSLYAASVGRLLIPADAPPALVAAVPWIIGASVAIGIAIDLALLHFIVRRGSNVARGILVALFALGLFGIVRHGLSAEGMPPALHFLSLLHLLLQAICLWLLFQADARPWFEHGRRG